MTIMVLIVHSIVSHAQKPVYKHYTTEDNLPHDITYQIMQDGQGYVWIGTDDGLSKFNGTEFTNFSYEDGLQSNYVIDISESSPNEYLIATWGAGLHHLKNDSIYKSNIGNDSFTKIKKAYKLNDSLVYGSRRHRPFIYNIKQNKKNLCYIVINDKTSNPEISFTKPDVDTSEYLINEAYLDSTLYFFAYERQTSSLKTIKGLHIYENHTLKKLNYPELNDVAVHSVAKDNRYLLAASFNKIVVYDGKKLIDERLLNVKDETIVYLQRVNNTFYFISNNSIDGTRKLYSYDWHNGHLSNLSSKLGINSFISDFMFDRDNSLWITTYGQGVFYLPNSSNLFFGKDFFPNPDLKHIAIFQDNLLTIAPNTVYEIENDSLKSEITIPFHTEEFVVDDKTKEINLISYQTKKIKATVSGYKLVNRDTQTLSISF